MTILSWFFYAALVAGGLYFIFRPSKEKVDPIPDPPAPEPAKPKIVHRVKAAIKKKRRS